MLSEDETEYQNLKSLDLSFKKLHSMPKYVFELSSLEVVFKIYGLSLGKIALTLKCLIHGIC